MLKNLDGIMPKEKFSKDMLALYDRMETMTSDFERKITELAEYNRVQDQNAEQHKTFAKSEQIKTEPALKKAKTVSAAKKSVFIGTPLDTSSVASGSFMSPVLNSNVTKITDSDYSANILDELD